MFNRIHTQECSKKHKTILTVEEHNLSGGFGSAVAEVLAEIEGAKAKLGKPKIYTLLLLLLLLHHFSRV